MTRRLARFFLVVLAGFVVTTGIADADTPVTLRASSALHTPSIRLSDVFDGLPDGRDRDIALAPQPGQSVVYDTRILARLAQAYRLDWQPHMGDYARLTTAATTIGADSIRKAVLDALVQQGLKGTLTLTFDGRDPVINLPADRTADFTLAHFTYDADTRRFRAEVTVPDRAIAPMVVAGRVSVTRSVPTLNRRLERGTVIAESDISMDEINEDRIGNDIVIGESEIVGRELRHDMASGTPFRVHDVMEPRLVTRGSLVTLKIETPVMLATAQGRAMDDGSEGGVVRVTNTQSHRIIEGVVVASGVVRVGGDGNAAGLRVAEAH